MEGEDSILDSLYDDDNFEDAQDVEMLDVEEGELVEHESNNVEEGELVENGSNNVLVQSSGGKNVSGANQERQSKSKTKKKKRRNKNRGNNGGQWTDGVDIDRFVMRTCKDLKEKKSYMVYTAVACLGVAALSELIREVNAVQACGGQWLPNKGRMKTGGGLLWNIIKAREPKAYKEIMKKAKEFEKQFKQPCNRQPPKFPTKEGPSQVIANSSEDGALTKVSNDLQRAFEMPEMQTQDNQSNPRNKHVSVHDRLRIPVSYDDDLLAAGPNDAAV